jgi:hypothetical protein
MPLAAAGLQAGFVTGSSLWLATYKGASRLDLYQRQLPVQTAGAGRLRGIVPERDEVDL